MYKKTLFVLAFLALYTSFSIAQEVEFNYNGRVKVQGQAYTGVGYFKFTLVNKEGGITLWANDGVTLTGSEPLSSIASDVSEGFFTVNIGDTNTTNMAVLDASLFNSKQRIFLRTWFSDGTHGFEQLKPDRQVVNPALLGSKSFQPIDIYIDPQNGDNSFSGLKQDKPKKTIQAAWSALPSQLETTATLHLMNGVYREEALLKGKLTLGESKIIIIGNSSSPDLVRITGAEAGNENLQVRQYGLHLENQKGLEISGISFDRTYAGIFLNQYSSAILRKCKFRENGVGAYSSYFSFMECHDLDVASTIFKPDGLKITDHSSAVVFNCNISDVYIGIQCIIEANVSVFACHINNCSLAGVDVSQMSFGMFPWDSNPAQLNTFSNNSKGIFLGSNSAIMYPNSGGINFIGNTTNISNDGSGVITN